MRIDVMTDIETLGTNADSTIIQISAIAFNIQTGEHFSEFNQIVDVSKNENPLKVTGNTIKWWLNTDKELFAKLLNDGNHSSEQVLRNFHDWIINLVPEGKTESIYLWGNGILFDNKMIQHQMEAIGLTYPIFFRNDRDLRTLRELACVKMGITERELLKMYSDDSLILHNAFDDVVFQIRVATICYNELMGRVNKDGEE